MKNANTLPHLRLSDVSLAVMNRIVELYPDALVREVERGYRHAVWIAFAEDSNTSTIAAAGDLGVRSAQKAGLFAGIPESSRSDLADSVADPTDDQRQPGHCTCDFCVKYGGAA